MRPYLFAGPFLPDQLSDWKQQLFEVDQHHVHGAIAQQEMVEWEEKILACMEGSVPDVHHSYIYR